MASPIQIITEQIADAAISNAKIDSAAVTPVKMDLATAGLTYNFGSVALLANTESANDNSNKVATTEYVENAVSASALTGNLGIEINGSNEVNVDIDIGACGLTFSDLTSSGKLQIHVGNGIALDTADDGKVSIDLATNPGLEFDAGQLKVLLNSDAFSLDAQGIAIVVDDASIEISVTNGLQIKDLGVTTAKINDLAVTTGKIAAAAVETAKLADSAVTAAKLALVPEYEESSMNGSDTTITLGNSVPTGYEKLVAVFKNGQRMAYAASPSGADEYSVSGSTVTFGSAPTSGTLMQVTYWYE
jgi:hypothetical protein